jgi:hypothetical protein
MNQTLRDRENLADKFWKSILEPKTVTVPAMTPEAKALGEVIATIDPVLSDWRAANPRAHSPRWWAVLYDFCKTTPDRAWCACGMFVQTAQSTDTSELLRIAKRAIHMAACNHERGTWSGSERAVCGEYEDTLLFSCPDCGYKGA